MRRHLFHLPIATADVRVGADPLGAVTVVAPDGNGNLDLSWTATGTATLLEAGSLTAFLGERDLVMAADAAESAWIGRVDHEPVPVAPADAHIAVNTLDLPLFEPGARPVLAHAIGDMRTQAWLPRRLRARDAEGSWRTSSRRPRPLLTHHWSRDVLTTVHAGDSRGHERSTP